MQIPLQPYLNKLAQRHGIITVAVVDTRDVELVPPAPIMAMPLTDGRLALVKPYGGSEEITRFLTDASVTPQCWLEFRELDRHFDVATYSHEIDSRYAEVQTGMLDELFGYVVVQAITYGDLLATLELALFKREDLRRLYNSVSG